jgi:hypothetical protein
MLIKLWKQLSNDSLLTRKTGLQLYTTKVTQRQKDRGLD